MSTLFDNIPKYEGGICSSNIYNVGCGIEDDKDSPSDKDCYAMIISQTNEEEYRAYIQKLIDSNFILIYKNTIDGNIFTQLLGNQLLYVYFTKSKSEVRIISDNCSVPLDTFSYGWDD